MRAATRISSNVSDGFFVSATWNSFFHFFPFFDGWWRFEASEQNNNLFIKKWIELFFYWIVCFQPVDENKKVSNSVYSTAKLEFVNKSWSESFWVQTKWSLKPWPDFSIQDSALTRFFLSRSVTQACFYRYRSKRASRMQENKINIFMGAISCEWLRITNQKCTRELNLGSGIICFVTLS